MSVVKLVMFTVPELEGRRENISLTAILVCVPMCNAVSRVLVQTITGQCK